MKFTFDCAFIARLLIAFLFVYAGVGKIMEFAGTEGYIASMNVPLPAIAAIIAIIVEVPVALLYAYGYKKDIMGWILIAFTVIATAIFHNPWMGGTFDQSTLNAALKNIAIIGGILGTIGCVCGMCKVSDK